MKFRRIYVFSGTDKKEDGNDYVDRYVSDNGDLINVCYYFSSINVKCYTVNGNEFNTLREAKQYVINRRQSK